MKAALAGIVAPVWKLEVAGGTLTVLEDAPVPVPKVVREFVGPVPAQEFPRYSHGAIKTDTLSAPVTHLLQLRANGDKDAENDLFRIIFGHLRRIAAAHLRKQGERAPLEPTELVNEAYLHVFGENSRYFANRTHFFAVAARAMRCILIDLARKRIAAKRNWGNQVSFSDFAHPGQNYKPETLLSFEAALQKLSTFDPRAAQIVELKIFVGLTDVEAGDFLGLCGRTVKRDYRAAKSWLQAELRPDPKAAPDSPPPFSRT